MESALRGWRGSDVTLVHGDARGADRMAADIATGWGWSVEPHPASGFSWPTVRNTHMVGLGADVCVAFPTSASRGTYDCANKAFNAGITTVYHDAHPHEPNQ